MNYYYLLFIEGKWRIKWLNYSPLILPPTTSNLTCTTATIENCPNGLVIYPIWEYKNDDQKRIGGIVADLYEVVDKVLGSIKVQGKYKDIEE